MAKRFTDSNKYKKKFYRNLPGAYKLFWDFLYHDCDNCGIWIVDIKTAQGYVGDDMPVNLETALELFNADEERIVQIKGGEKWFLPGYIEFQYVQLSEKNRAHISVIAALKKLNLLNEDLTLKQNHRGVVSPLQGVKATAKEQDKDKDKEQEDEKLCFDAQELIAENKIQFERICMSAGRSDPETAKQSLRKFHLHLQAEKKYPRTRRQLFAGFEKWLMDDKNFNNGKEFKGDTGKKLHFDRP